ncbi:MAG: hypothetical protein PUJ75_04290 [Bacteroidales bacterium]|nr:hypothetical protein [Bacteroidales bacterium]MDD7574909.1 hypothetical protein [Bacteroidales bacterium]MDY5789515.1 hypothetical protein [Candidatus Onthomorpha sp.]
MDLYKNFQKRFRLLALKRQDLIINTLSNIFTMRLIGNKTHGDLAEIGIAEFIHQFMYDFKCDHVGKKLYRAKEHEEDIIVTDEITQESIPISLKAYGEGPLQLATDKKAQMFSTLEEYEIEIKEKEVISNIFQSEAFSLLDSVNVMSLIYKEESTECNILVFNFDKMKEETHKILFIDKGYSYDKYSHKMVQSKNRKHPIYVFIDKQGNYICEVRYGNAEANALQRGLWTDTKIAYNYFTSLTNGWISYKHNLTLIELMKLALNSTENGHEEAKNILQADIENLMQQKLNSF